MLPRGHTLEAVVTRMKTISKTIKSKCGIVNSNGGGDDGGAQDNNGDSSESGIRFMAVSATVPNAEDVVEWLGSPRKEGGGANGNGGGVHYKFGEEKRPVQLRKVVIGYPTRTGRSDFKFEWMLTYKLADLITSYSEGKPTLIFTISRRSAQFSAEVLVKNTRFQFGWAQKQRLHDSLADISDSKLREIAIISQVWRTLYSGLESGFGITLQIQIRIEFQYSNIIQLDYLTHESIQGLRRWRDRLPPRGAGLRRQAGGGAALPGGDAARARQHHDARHGSEPAGAPGDRQVDVALGQQ